MKKQRALMVLLAVIALIVAACGDGGGEGTEDPGEEPEVGELGAIEVADGDPIKIASLQAISGDAASLGTDQVRAIELAIVDRAEVAGHPIELAFNEDDLCNSEGGQTGATRIVADPDVVAVIGTSCSGAGVPASNVVSEAGRVLISGSNTSPYLTSDLAGNEGPDHHDG